MVSRKKAKGKARKKAQAQKETEERDQSHTAATAADDTASLGAQIERLSVNNANNAILSARDRSSCNHGVDPTTISWSNVGCTHGLDLMATPEVCVEFAEAFVKGFNDAVGEDGIAVDPYSDAMESIFLIEKYGEVLEDLAKIELVLSIFAAEGTCSMLEGEITNASAFASFLLYFKEVAAAMYAGTQRFIEHATLCEMNLGKYFGLLPVGLKCCYFLFLNPSF